METQSDRRDATRIVLIRHAESVHAHQGVIADVAGCRGLTAAGFHQAQRLAARVHHTGELADCTALLCSPVLRARQTAEALVRVLPVTSLQADSNLCEVRPGEADGLTWAAYRARYGAFDLLAAPDRPFAPGGESWTQFVRRVQATVQHLAERFAGQTVVAVTHAGFIVVSVLALFDIPRPGTGARIDPGHTSLTAWSRTAGTWRLERFNDAYHLLTR